MSTDTTETTTPARAPNPDTLAFQERMLAQALEALPPGPMRLMLNGTAWRALTDQARRLGQSAFVPDHLRPSKKQIDDGKLTDAQVADITASNVVGALMLAACLGENPFQVMADVFFVGGRPAWKTEALIARLRKHLGLSVQWRVESSGQQIAGAYKKVEWRDGPNGRRQPVDIEVPFKAPDFRITAYATDARGNVVMHDEPQPDGSLRSVPSTVTVTMAEAIADGWVSNAKYATLPERMLRWRAASYWISSYAPEIKSGLPMDVEIDHMPERGEVPVVVQQPAHRLPDPPRLDVAPAAPPPIEHAPAEAPPIEIGGAK